MAHQESGIPIPPDEFVLAVGGGDFRATGEHFFRIFVDHAGLEPRHRVLDVGSGCGRLAIPLTTYLAPDTEYHGIDVVGPMVQWCRDNISSRHPNFRFHLAELTNTLYSQTGTSAAGYRFPFADGTFDFVYLTSVFTHLNPADTDNYLAEIRRVLAPAGRGLMTFYLMTPEYADNRRTGRARVTFDHGSHPYWVNDPRVPEAVSAYDETYILDRIQAAGLAVDVVSHGGWNGRHGLSFQDVILASRRD